MAAVDFTGHFVSNVGGPATCAKIGDSAQIAVKLQIDSECKMTFEIHNVLGRVPPMAIVAGR